jgi:hypothetical protein
VSGEINFNFGRSVFFLSKSEVKMLEFVLRRLPKLSKEVDKP